jgi:hypothetical protein
MKGNSKLGSPPWITAEGMVDLTKLPIDFILTQAIRFHSAISDNSTCLSTIHL